MATSPFSFSLDELLGGGGGDGGFGGGGMATSTGTRGGVISPLINPDFNQLYKRTAGAIPTKMPSLESLIQGGMSSPLLSAVLEPALQRLVAPQAAQRQQFTEAARAAGGLRGSTYGQGMNTLMQNQAQGQNDLMGQVIQQILGTLVQGQLQEQRNAFLPAQSMTDLLRTIRPDVVRPTGGTSTSGGWEGIPASQGLGTPTSPTPGFDAYSQQLQGLGGVGGGGVQRAAPGVQSPGVTTPGGPPNQYVDPYSGMSGGNAIAQNPYTGVYETVAPSNLSPYQHTYGEWTNVDPFEEAFF